MVLTESHFLGPSVAQQCSTHHKHARSGDQGPSTCGIAAHPMSATEHGHSTFPQQEASEHVHKQYFTQNIAPCQLKHQWTQQNK